MHIRLLRNFVASAAAAARQVLLSGLFLLTFLAVLTVEGRAQTALSPLSPPSPPSPSPPPTPA